MCSMIEFYVFACSINIYFLIYHNILVLKLCIIMNYDGEYGGVVMNKCLARPEMELKVGLSFQNNM